jgi:molecular chaperone GrpE
MAHEPQSPGVADEQLEQEEPVSEEAGSDEPDGELAAAGEPEPEPEPDWHDIALRKAAELENVRKQTAQRVQKATRDGMRRIATELLPALDDFERALTHAEAEEGDAEHHLTKGIRLAREQMLAALRRVGIETYGEVGDQFDPHLHEAVAQIPGGPMTVAGTITDVYQAGYRLGDDVLRAAKVVVAG